MKEVLRVVSKARKDMANLAEHLLYTQWPTTRLNIVGNDVHYNLGKALRSMDALIKALVAFKEEE